MTVDGGSWGFRRDMKIEEILGPEELIETLVSTVACGGNILINVLREYYNFFTEFDCMNYFL